MIIDESPTLVAQLLPDAPFRERHERTIEAPIDVVWAACTEVTNGEIRLLGPLMAARGLPAALRARRKATITPAVRDQPILDTFRDEGFMILHRDDIPVGRRATLTFGAAGRFWSITENHAVPFGDPDDLITLARGRAHPGLAITVADLSATDNGNGTTTVTTETRVVGTDSAATKAFGRYWFAIRLGSGAIRRSWLAAIERRARR